MSPSERPHAIKIQNHHAFFPAKEYQYASREASRLRHLGAFVLPTIGWKHDMLHATIQGFTPPNQEICDTIHEIGLETPADKPWVRMESIIDTIATEASFEREYKRSDDLMAVAFHLASQLAIIRTGEK